MSTFVTISFKLADVVQGSTSCFATHERAPFWGLLRCAFETDRQG